MGGLCGHPKQGTRPWPLGHDWDPRLDFAGSDFPRTEILWRVRSIFVWRSAKWLSIMRDVEKAILTQRCNLGHDGHSRHDSTRSGFPDVKLYGAREFFLRFIIKVQSIFNVHLLV